MLVLFDLDNTLGDRARAVRSWACDFVEEHGLDRQAVDWFLAADNDGYRDRRAVFADFLDAWLDVGDQTATVDKMVAEYRRSVVARTTLTLGARDCLIALRSAGAALAIVTNGSSGQQHAKIDHLGLRPLVDAVIVSDDLAINKPDPRIFEAAALAVGQPLEGAWMVGDSPHHDIEGAAALGLGTAWLHRGRPWPFEHVHPTVALDDLTEFADFLDAVGGAYADEPGPGRWG